MFSTANENIHDPVGNRLSNLSGSGWSNNTSNELISRPGVTYTYDNNGNATSKTDSTGTTSYTWDFENRLSTVILPGSGGTITFKYDPFGRRIYKSSSSGTSIYAYDGENVIEETNSSGAAVARYLQTQKIDEPLAMLRGGTTSYYEVDGLGSVTSLSSPAGVLAQTYTLDSFGNQTASTGSLTNPFRYTGREFDTETSLHYYRRRYYDQTTGRFLSEDPIGFAGGKDFYPYVANNPVKRKDPLGLWQLTIGGGVGLGGLITIGHNGGQWNFGLYSGGGVGVFGRYDPTDSGGCRKFGAYGAATVQADVGLAKYFSVGGDASVDEGSREPDINFEATVPGVGGISWNPDPYKPHQPPHGVIAGGEGGFAGIGFVHSSPPSSQCGCGGE
jgi:RHS repeat-associated protein